MSSKSVSQSFKILFQTGDINNFVLRGVFFSRYAQANFKIFHNTTIFVSFLLFSSVQESKCFFQQYPHNLLKRIDFAEKHVLNQTEKMLFLIEFSISDSLMFWYT